MTREQARRELLRRAIQNAKQWSNHVEIDVLCAIAEVYPDRRGSFEVTLALLRAMFPANTLIESEGEVGVVDYPMVYPPAVAARVVMPCPDGCRVGCNTCFRVFPASVTRRIDPGDP